MTALAGKGKLAALHPLWLSCRKKYALPILSIHYAEENMIWSVIGAVGQMSVLI